jgi:hypothetical protein
MSLPFIVITETLQSYIGTMRINFTSAYDAGSSSEEIEDHHVLDTKYFLS